MTTEAIVIVGVAVNVLTTAAGIVGLLLKFERRMTRVETLLNALPKRRSDDCA